MSLRIESSPSDTHGIIPHSNILLAMGAATLFQAFDFTLSGPLASPQVSLDPISALAPGALRDLVRRLPVGISPPGGKRP